MQYLGGKSRISNQISEILNKYTKDRIFYSLFCGSGAIESKVKAEKLVLNDSHPYLIEMFKAVQSGWQIPLSISKDEYEYVKKNKDENRALTGFVGFACSFGGKWFGGYAHLKDYAEKNYASYSRNSLIRKMKTLNKAEFHNLDYKNIEVKDNSVVYCDPPYEGTTKYSNSNEFNHEEFWEYVRNLSKNNIVFISEYHAPEDFVSIWEKEQSVKFDVNKKNIFKNLDRLFVHKSNIDKILLF